MAIGSISSGQQFGPAASGPSNSILADFYRTDLKLELALVQRDAAAGASDKVAALTPIVLNDAQNAQLPQDIINGPRGLAAALQNGGDSERLKAAYDLVVADSDPQSLLGPGNPSMPPPPLYNQSNTAAFQSSPYGAAPPPYSPPSAPPPYTALPGPQPGQAFNGPPPPYSPSSYGVAPTQPGATPQFGSASSPAGAGQQGGYPGGAGQAGGNQAGAGQVGGYPPGASQAGGNQQGAGQAGGNQQGASQAGGNQQAAGQTGGNQQGAGPSNGNQGF